MKHDRQDEKVEKNIDAFIGPCGEYNCPICIFSKSNAPGNPYDLSKCPKFNSLNKKKKDQKTQVSTVPQETGSSPA